jgi:hypothetical protein
MKGKLAGPLDRCIYGDHPDPEGFTDEHVIPRAFGETAYIDNASCHSCGAITSGIELYCARHIFQELRIHHSIKGRKHKKAAPSVFPITVEINGQKVEHVVPVEHHPSLLILPAVSAPGILTGEAPSAVWPDARFHCWVFKQHIAGAAALAKKKGGTSYEVTKTVGPERFFRLVAKIGHCFAVAVRGYGTFKPYLPGVILGSDPHIPYLVGGETSSKPPGTMKHELRIEETERGGKLLLIARVRLFANVGSPENGTPIYYAVVGEQPE